MVIPHCHYMVCDDANPDSPFHDIRVRQAVSHAIDKAGIAQAVGLGYWKPSNQPANPDGRFYNPDVVGYPYDPEKAKQLMAEAGYPNGFKTTLINMPHSPYTLIFEALSGVLAEVGIEADRVLEALEAALADDGELLNSEERTPIDQAAAELQAKRNSNDPRAIKQALDELDKAAAVFVSRRMDTNIQKALSGHSVNEFSE